MTTEHALSRPAPVVDSRLVDLFLELAAVDGASGEERAVADRIVSFLARLGFPAREEPPPRGRGAAGNVTCQVGRGGEVLLFAHMDTARPTRGLRPRVLDDRICSDGTTMLGADNRAGVAILLRTLERIALEGIETPGFHVAFTVCEETSLSGSRTLPIPERAAMGIAFDSSLRPGAFIHGSHGARTFTVAVEGRAAHAGLAPEQGVNAVAVAAEAIAALPLGRLDEHTTANIGSIHGGTAVNVVPEVAVVEGEVRSLSPDRIDEVLGQVHRAFLDAAELAGAGVKLSTRWAFQPFEIDLDAPVCRRLTAALERVGLTPRPTISAGGSDANSLNGRGLPSVNVGIGAQRPHANEEFILLEDLQRGAEIAMALVLR
jgi:tripeptide aminopeptidase